MRAGWLALCAVATGAAPTRPRGVRAVAARERAREAAAQAVLVRGAEPPTAAFAIPDGGGAPVGVAVVVDPLCDYLGRALIEELLARDVAVATCLSDYMAAGLGATYGETAPAALLAPEAGGERAWLGDCPVAPVACFSESEAGVATAERLGAALGCAFANDADGATRRHKFLAHEALKAAGLPHCRQRLCASAAEVVAFFEEEAAGAPIVVKPPRGVGSDGVFGCATRDDCEDAFAALVATSRYGGGPNDAVLAQARLVGREYAVDTASRAGDHRATAVWAYDKAEANGAPFVYRATRLVDAATDARVPAVLAALRAALDALGHAHGPAHSELIVDAGGAATLVEVNARFHNANVRPLVDRCVASPNAIAAAAAACLPDATEWAAVPRDPTLLRAGVLVHLVSYVAGEVAAVDADAVAALEALPTLVAMEIYAGVGDRVEKTVDIKTDSGWLLLAGDDADVAADAARARALEGRLFTVR